MSLELGSIELCATMCDKVAEAGNDWPVKAPGKTAANLGWWKYECNVFTLISGGKVALNRLRQR